MSSGALSPADEGALLAAPATTLPDEGHGGATADPQAESVDDPARFGLGAQSESARRSRATRDSIAKECSCVARERGFKD